MQEKRQKKRTASHRMRSEKTNSNKCLDCPAGSQILQKALHRFGRGGPAGDQADTGVLGIHRVVHFKFIAQVLQRLHHAVGQDGELLVGGGVGAELVTQGGDALPQGRLARALAWRAISKYSPFSRSAWNCTPSSRPLASTGAPLLHMPAEPGAGGVQHHRLTEEGAVFGAADGKHIRECGQIGQGHVGTGNGQGAAQAGAVEIEQQAVAVTALGAGR